MPDAEAILIDSSIWIKGQRHPGWLEALVEDLEDVATCEAAAGEFSVGLYAPRQKATRDQVRAFLQNVVSAVAWIPHPPEDFREASRLIGEAIYSSKARPSFPDGLIAACALRTDRVIWTDDETDFRAMGCKTFNPWAKHPPDESAAA